MWSRRAFIAAAGASFVGGLSARAADTLADADLVFATAGKMLDGTFAAALVSERGQLIHALPLPSRGHDVTQCPVSGRLVVFARRPGTFAIVFSREGETLATITSAEGRHFFGHGAFSPDGKLLYATENNFDAGDGIIGIYDASNGFRRIAEFSSGGVGPHDVMLSDDGKVLCIANGGIETHPDYGRTKLNLATMQPNICWIDADTGTHLASHDLPDELHQLSLRHMAKGANGKIWVGGQYQGTNEGHVPLLASVGLNDPLVFAPLPQSLTARLSSYVGSVAASDDGRLVAVTSPHGNVSIVFDTVSEQSTLTEAESVCGADWTAGGFAYSTGKGYLSSPEGLASNNAGFLFDNHLVRTST